MQQAYYQNFGIMNLCLQNHNKYTTDGETENFLVRYVSARLSVFC